MEHTFTVTLKCDLEMDRDEARLVLNHLISSSQAEIANAPDDWDKPTVDEIAENSEVTIKD
jgi:hypothetical protein